MRALTGLLSLVLLLAAAGGHTQTTDARARLFAQAEAAREAAVEAGAEQLSPLAFERGREALAAASADFDRGRSMDRVRDRLAEAETAFRRAEAGAREAAELLAPGLKARGLAAEAGAELLAGERWRRGQSDLRQAALAFERGDRDQAERRARDAAEHYRTAELDAIKDRVLTETRALIAEARDRRVQRRAPRTLERAEALLAEAETALEQDRYDTDRPRELARQAHYQARHALYLADFIAELGNRRASLEDVILALEEPVRELAARADIVAEFDQGFGPPVEAIGEYIETLARQNRDLEADLEERTGQVYALEEEASRLHQRLGSVADERKSLERALEAQAMARQRVAEVEALFEPDEADVLRQGEEILIRLAGFDFPSGSAEIPERNRDLMHRLETALRLFPGARLTVAGHTDSFGGDAANFELSRRRAEAVRQALMADLRLPAEHISAVGYGETRPVASNQTPEGRARNRRIDVAVLPAETER